MRVIHRNLAVGVLMFALAGAGCARHAASSTASRDATATIAGGTQPSQSARMICASEGQREIASALGTTPIAPPRGRWRDRTYSCEYVYRAGTMTLSVKELPRPADAKQYFDALGPDLGRGPNLQGLGASAYQTNSGATVVRKDNLVLVVDVSRLPTRFGMPASPRRDVSLSVAATIMGCWTGD